MFGYEIGGVIVECGEDFIEDFMRKLFMVGLKVMILLLMFCGYCYYCIYYLQIVNKCLMLVYYGCYFGFDKVLYLWGGWVEYVYVDFEMLFGIKIYKLFDDMLLWFGVFLELLIFCICVFNCVICVGGFIWGDMVVIQGLGLIGILAVVVVCEMGVGCVICVGVFEEFWFKFVCEFGVEVMVNIEEIMLLQVCIVWVCEIVGGFGVDFVMDCLGYLIVGFEGIEMLCDGGIYVEMGQFIDVGFIEIFWYCICIKDFNVFGFWGFIGNDLLFGVDMFYCICDKYFWFKMQMIYLFIEEGIVQVVKDVMVMKMVKLIIVFWLELVE